MQSNAIFTNRSPRCAIPLALLLTLATALAAASAAPPDHDKKTARAEVGKSAPDFALLDCAGKKHKLSDYQDKIVVLEWVNQECPWSRKAVPTIKKLQKEFNDDKIVWIGIESTHWRKAKENLKYKKDQKLDFPILMDNDGKVGRLYGAKTTPHMFIINKGKLVYAGGLHNNQHGNVPEAKQRNYVAEALRAVLADKNVPLAKTQPWGCSVKYKKSK